MKQSLWMNTFSYQEIGFFRNERQMLRHAGLTLASIFCVVVQAQKYSVYFKDNSLHIHCHYQLKI